jgi:hypothetical protein
MYSDGAMSTRDLISEAAKKKVRLNFVYDGKQRWVAPYSYRVPPHGALLMAWDFVDETIKSWDTTKMEEVHLCRTGFTPKWCVEIS